MHAIQHLFPTKKTLLLRLGAVALTLLLTAGLLSQAVFAQTTYVITDGDRVLVHTTYATDPAAVLTEAGLELGEEDTFTTQSDGNVSEITVNRIQMVRVNHDGQALEVATYGSTVSGILEQLGISTEGDLRISQSLDSATYDGMVIDVVALTYETVEYVRSEPYQTIYCTDSTLAPGEEQVLTPGQEGSVHCTARITRENGTEVSRTVTQERVLYAPVNAVVARGIDRSSKEQEGAGRAYAPAVEASEPDRSAATSQAEGSGEAVLETEPDPASTTPATEPAPSGNTFTTASGEVLTYSQKLSVEATAYSCEGYAGTTATGTTARYGAIAVDPSVIPYGTRMYIVSDDGSYIYGYATAEDCGGAIQGYMIDLYFDTLAECYAFGRRTCTVYILD